MYSLVEELQLSEGEIKAFVLHKKQGTTLLKTLSNREDLTLKEKLRSRAVYLALQKQLQALPFDEEIYDFRIQLEQYSSSSLVDDQKMIDYIGYKNAMDSCSPALRGFLSVRLFMNLRISNIIGSSERVSVDSIIEFLQVKKNKILKMIHLKSCDSSGKGYLSSDDLSCSIKELVLQQATHLHDLVLDDPIMLSCYECIATRKFFFFLDTIGHKKIRIIDIIATGWLEEIVDAGCTEHLDNYDATNILELSDRSRSTVVSNWFSRANFLYIQCLYSRLDSDGNGLLSLSEMENFRFISNAFIRRVFETRQTYNDNEIDLVAFCDFILAIGHPSEPASIRYYFRALDVDGDGFLNATDLQYFYDHIAKMLFECHNEEDGILPPAFEDVKDEIFDMCRPSDPAKITLNELIASGNGETIVSMLTDSEAFISYEFREDSTY